MTVRRMLTGLTTTFRHWSAPEILPFSDSSTNPGPAVNVSSKNTSLHPDPDDGVGEVLLVCFDPDLLGLGPLLLCG
jgi:hypothetical protein